MFSLVEYSNKKNQKGVSLLEVSLALVMLTVSAIDISKYLLVIRQRTTVSILAGKVNVFTSAVSAYLKDNQYNADQIDGKKISVIDLMSQNYIPGDLKSGYLSKTDFLYAMIKKDITTNKLEALVYNDCPLNMTSCQSQINTISSQINTAAGTNSGFKHHDSNGNITVLGAFGSWILQPSDWPTVNFDNATVFTLTSYDPTPSGVFVANPVEIKNFEYDYSNAGLPGQRKSILNNNTTLKWQPLFDTDSLDFHWSDSDISYVKIQRILEVNNQETVVHTDIITSTSYIVKSNVDDLGKLEKLVFTPYDENGRAGVPSEVKINISSYQSSVWSQVTVNYHFFAINDQSSGSTPSLLTGCDTNTGQADFVSKSDLYFSIDKLKFQLKQKDFDHIPPGTQFLMPQNISFKIGSNNTSFNISTSDPFKLEEINLDPFIVRYNVIPTIPGVHNESNDFFYRDIIKQCVIDPSGSNDFSLELGIDTSSKRLNYKTSDTSLTLKEYSIILKNK